eukprot:11219189-Alexandrium_andersonii.AAC.1
MAGFRDIVYADDLDACKVVDSALSDDEVFQLIRNCQAALRRWGSANQVSFDASKEGSRIISRHRAAGANFLFLGIEFDCKLLMHDAVREC